MGYIITAKCQCGYEKSMFLGVGFNGALVPNGFPFDCKSCRSVVVASANDSQPSCPECGGSGLTSYADLQMYLGELLRYVVFNCGEAPDNRILRATSPEAYFRDWLEPYSDVISQSAAEENKTEEQLMEEFRRELFNQYSVTWEKVRSGGYRVIYDCSYPCPRCTHRNLRFDRTGLWD